MTSSPPPAPKLTGIKPVDTFPVGGLGGCTPTGTCNSFTGGCFCSAGGLGCMPWAAFDGLPAELRRTVSGRMFLETPLPLPDADQPKQGQADNAGVAGKEEETSPRSPESSGFVDRIAEQALAVQACLQD
ncbi:hypothetical protein ABPG75_011515 [Micractinium tetrahymenae]